MQGKLMVFLNWKNGQKTKHTTEVIYKKCPQKVCCLITWAMEARRLWVADRMQMLKFYEQHVRIIKQEPQVDVPQTG